MPEYTLPRTGLAAVRFTGQLLARSPDRITADDARRGRWTSISAYLLTHSPLTLLHVHYATDHHGEADNHLTALTQDPAAYLETLDLGEWCARAPPADRATVRAQYHAACATLISQLTAKQLT